MKILKTTLSYQVLLAVLLLQHSNLTVIQQIKNSQPLKGHRILLIKMTKAKNRQKKTHTIYVTSFVFFYFKNIFYITPALNHLVKNECFVIHTHFNRMLGIRVM